MIHNFASFYKCHRKLRETFLFRSSVAFLNASVSQYSSSAYFTREQRVFSVYSLSHCNL